MSCHRRTIRCALRLYNAGAVPQWRQRFLSSIHFIGVKYGQSLATTYLCRCEQCQTWHERPTSNIVDDLLKILGGNKLDVRTRSLRRRIHAPKTSSHPMTKDVSFAHPSINIDRMSSVDLSGGTLPICKR
jgi:hypothetical protein